jgi:hypothetical protein
MTWIEPNANKASSNLISLSEFFSKESQMSLSEPEFLGRISFEKADGGRFGAKIISA